MIVQEDPSVLGQHISRDTEDGRVLGGTFWLRGDGKRDPRIHSVTRQAISETLCLRPVARGLNHLVMGHPDRDTVNRQGAAIGIVDFRLPNGLHEAPAQK